MTLALYEWRNKPVGRTAQLVLIGILTVCWKTRQPSITKYVVNHKTLAFWWYKFQRNIGLKSEFFFLIRKQYFVPSLKQDIGNNKMKRKQYQTVGTIIKSNRKRQNWYIIHKNTWPPTFLDCYRHCVKGLSQNMGPNLHS